MGKWDVFGTDDFEEFDIWEDGRRTGPGAVSGKRIIGSFDNEEVARQICREHNAHEALVELVKEYRESMRPEGRPSWLSGRIMKIDAALALAEGREECSK